MKINNRRYLGNKYKLLSFITETVKLECKNVNTVFDVFAGTGAVASAFLDKTVIVNDILYSNHLAHLAWFSPEEFNLDKVSSLINHYNSLPDVEESNYMVENFSGTYFSKEVCVKIGYIREDIEKQFSSNNINNRERAVLVTSLLYAMDKIATTCGHYDAYRKGAEHNNNFVLELPDVQEKLSPGNRCYNTDSNILASEIECDLAYLDPPYNSRQYCDCYHLLENVAKWEKPEVKGIARKMNREHLKSNYCTNKAVSAFEDLINKLRCRYILLSYNNTEDKANSRSNARLTDDDIIRILSRKGRVKVFSQSYKAFTTGKSENNTNEERLFLCVVDNVVVKSPLNYTGGKGRLLPQIKSLFPKSISTMVDLFCGGATVGANTNAEAHIYNDIQSPLIGLLKTLGSTKIAEFISDIKSIISLYNLSNSAENGYGYYGCNSSDGLAKYNRDKFLKLRTDFNSLTVKDKRYYEMLFILIVFAFNNQIRFNSRGEFNLPVGKRDFNDRVQQNLIDFIQRIQAQDRTFSSLSFEQFDISILDSNSFVYCDPPYLITTATYNENGGWNEQDEINLLQFLDKLNAANIKFALSNVLIHKGKTNEILKKWVEQRKYAIHFLNYNYSNSNYQSKNTDNPTQEVLITNYQQG